MCNSLGTLLRGGGAGELVDFARQVFPVQPALLNAGKVKTQSLKTIHSKSIKPKPVAASRTTSENQDHVPPGLEVEGNLSAGASELGKELGHRPRLQ